VLVDVAAYDNLTLALPMQTNEQGSDQSADLQRALRALGLRSSSMATVGGTAGVILAPPNAFSSSLAWYHSAVHDHARLMSGLLPSRSRMHTPVLECAPAGMFPSLLGHFAGGKKFAQGLLQSLDRNSPSELASANTTPAEYPEMSISMSAWLGDLVESPDAMG